ARKMAASEAPTILIPIQTEAIPEEGKDKDVLSSTLHICANDPNFAVICAFLQKFSKQLGLNLMNFKHLQEWLSKNEEVSELRDIHIKLLRKTRKTVHEKSWESALSKFCFGYSIQDAWEIERFGYKNSSLKVKLRILRELLEGQFERNVKFRSYILNLNANTLRSEPIGRDRLGHAYWVTQDADCNLRIYQEHPDEEIWQVVATNRDEFVNLIARLRGNEVVLPSKDIGEADEDTSSTNSCPAKQPPSLEREDNYGEDKERGEAKDCAIVIPNLKIKVVSPEQEELKSRRVKPLLISQAKLGGNLWPGQAKKRSVDDLDSSPKSFPEEQQKKHRPTLLDTTRIKKPSRYESAKNRNDAESEEEDEEEDMDSELDDCEEEEDDDIDSAAADIEEDDDEDEEVGEAFENPKIIVRGRGSGRDCEALPQMETCDSLNSYNTEIEMEFSEVVEDPVLLVLGQGYGVDSLVGNTKNEVAAEDVKKKQSEPKAKFFFGEPGCLKLSPIKQTPKTEAKRSIFDSLTKEKSNGKNANYMGESPPRNGGIAKTSNKSQKSEEVNKNVSEVIESVNKCTITNKDGKTGSEVPQKSCKVFNEKEETAPGAPAKENRPVKKDYKQLGENKPQIFEQVKATSQTEMVNTCFENVFVNAEAVKQIPNDTAKAPDTISSASKTLNILSKSDTSISKKKNFMDSLKAIQETAGQDRFAKDNKPSDLITDQAYLFVGYDTIHSENHSQGIEKKIVYDDMPSSSKSLISNERGKSQEIKIKSNPKDVPTPLGETSSAPRSILLSTGSIGCHLLTTQLNRKRRLNDSQPALRNSDVQEEEHHQSQENNAAVDDLDVGGKRVKMRAKITNVEARRKVEAQKTNIEETTSSSGEEDPRSRRKIIAPNRFLEKAPSPKQKLVLSEILEKKLNENPEKEHLEIEAGEKNLALTSRDVTYTFSPPMMCPVTKPLKKNLLLQLRQESEEAPVPRKRTNSGAITPSIEYTSFVRDLSEDIYLKRRSSENEKEPVSNEPLLRQASPLVVIEKPKPDDKHCIEKEVDPLALPAGDSMPIELKTSSPSGSGRRSGRRGGAVVGHSELPQSKRTRCGFREKLETNIEQESEQYPEEDNNEEETLKIAYKTMADIKKESANKEPIKKPRTHEEESEEDHEEKEEVPKVGRGRGPRKKREVDTTNIIEANDSETPVRQSRRIAQQKIKEEAERRKLEEVALRSMKQELKKKKKAEKEADPTVLEPSGEESESEASEAEEAHRKKKRKCPGKDGWSSDSEEQPESEEEEEEPPHYETDPGSPLFQSDHEFSPESEMEDDSQVVPTKRARTVRKENADDQEDNEEEACQKCGKSDHPEWILLCDTPACNKGYHCSCLSPVLFNIPEGDWHCPPCQQEQLIVALQQQLLQFDALVAKKQQERLAEEQAERERQEREAATKEFEGSAFKEDDEEGEYKKVSKVDKVKRRRGDGRSNRRAATRGTRRRRGNKSDSSNGKSIGSGSGPESGSESGSSLSSENRSSFLDSDDEPIYKLRKRRQINVSYRLNEYDELINSALKKEMDEVAGAGNLGRGKDIATIIEADKEKESRSEMPEKSKGEKEGNQEKKHNNNECGDSSFSSSENDVPLKPGNKFMHPSAKKKSRKLTTLDVSSEEDHGSDEDFKTSSYSDEDSSQSGSGESDSSLEFYRRPGRGKMLRKAASRAARERLNDRKFVVEESDESEEPQPRKSKAKKKEDSDFTETELDDEDENGSELSENMDSADLCDDTTSDSEDGAWCPSSKKKTVKLGKKSGSAVGIARVSPKLQKPDSHPTRKAKRPEYSDDDISESEPEDEEEGDDGGASLSGKGSGKQPRSQPLIPSGTAVQAGKGKSAPRTKKRKPSSSNEEEDAGSDDRTRTRGRRYAYIEDDDDSSDGGIKPGVHRPDTPPEERQKFIQRQEEIKRMLAEKNAEGAKLAATPRLTPIKAGSTVSGQEKRSPGKTSGGDSLSTVPLSVIRQAKVLDIDYLQRKGETIGDLEDVNESELDDAELPDDLPEDMEDAIARMVEEEEQFTAAVAARELPGAEEVLRTTPLKCSTISSKGVTDIPVLTPAPNASGLQEPHRKRLPMPTMHPPLLRHQFIGSDGQGPQNALLLPPHQPPHELHPMLQRHLTQTVRQPQAMQLLQSALSAPLAQPLGRGAYATTASLAQQLPVVLSMPSTTSAHILQSSAASAAIRSTDCAAGNSLVDTKPRGRRKKVTPLRDQLQKQQTAAAVTAATSSATSGLVAAEKSKGRSIFKPHEDVSINDPTTQPSIITRITAHLPPHHGHGHGPSSPGNLYPTSTDLASFYNKPSGPSSSGCHSPTASVVPPRHLLRPQMPPGLPPQHSALRLTYGPPPPLRGSGPPATTTASSNTRPSFLHGAEHHGGIPSSIIGIYGSGPPPSRHASTHLNVYRGPSIYGNPSFPPRVSVPQDVGSIRTGSMEYGPRGYPAYGYYPPPPTLNTPTPHSMTSSVIVSAPLPSTPTNYSVSALTRDKSPVASLMQSIAPPPEVTSGSAVPGENSQKHPATLVITSQKLTTLEVYPSAKSPLAVADEVMGRPGSTNLPATIAEDVSRSPHDGGAPSDSAGAAAVGEFSGLVSYFSSQQDDYGT
ncbi:hypothetical protein KR009_010297, partial [Drosophila setifemur]